MTEQEKNILAVYPIKYCVRCGTQFFPKKYQGGALERTNQFRKRKYCGIECYRHSRLESGQFTEHMLRELAHQFLEDECIFCGVAVSGAGYRLSLHHIDGNPKNNDHLNLATLCNSCHLRFHDVLGTHQRGHKKTPTELFNEKDLNPEDLD